MALPIYNFNDISCLLVFAGIHIRLAYIILISMRLGRLSSILICNITILLTVLNLYTLGWMVLAQSIRLARATMVLPNGVWWLCPDLGGVCLISNFYCQINVRKVFIIYFYKVIGTLVLTLCFTIIEFLLVRSDGYWWLDSDMKVINILLQLSYLHFGSVLG